MSFSKSVGLQVVVDVAYCGIRSFSDSTCFVNEIVYLAPSSFTHDTENATFSWGLKVDGPWLHRVARKVDLLRVVERIVNCAIH